DYYCMLFMSSGIYIF
nr:immunoglobulin light chain junction region [Macaca mulatta]MOX69705.1 immunoglobulin light chain junction region [Macaca mulatta]MOX69748.1 immunoglobulin light chain junction region [Macaca mulatta]MOX70426.1 immunoglobulin light chain junction region [Macaca mulatta]MOX71012.1 immunoglobulin light chain junction region [Macaca mulatta]